MKLKPDTIREKHRVLLELSPKEAASQYGEELMLLSFYQCGYSVNEIAEILDWSASKVRIWLSKLGITKKGDSLDQLPHLERIYLVFDSGATNAHVAATFGVGFREAFRSWIQYKSGLLRLRILCVRHGKKLTDKSVRVYAMAILGMKADFIAKVLEIENVALIRAIDELVAEKDWLEFGKEASAASTGLERLHSAQSSSRSESEA